MSPPLRLDRSWPLALAALAFAFALFEFTDLDLCVQDRLFDAAAGVWRVDGKDPLWRALFYSGPKFTIIAFGLVVLATAVVGDRIRHDFGLGDVPRADLWVLALTLATVPTLVGGLKDATNVFCPSENRRYGGDVAYAKVFDCFPESDRPARRGRCFPAGHSSGGFALCALAGVARTRRGQAWGIAVATAVGGTMGFYQMAKGAHYLSHTVVTAGLAWVVFLAWRRAFRRHRVGAGEENR
ncbi:MAG: phosphatase PAP2 family protein [Opitutaceae bacterium]|nr:phosphatase PAP2 family protein [Opitutaceae bacterium]